MLLTDRHKKLQCFIQQKVICSKSCVSCVILLFSAHLSALPHRRLMLFPLRRAAVIQIQRSPNRPHHRNSVWRKCCLARIHNNRWVTGFCSHVCFVQKLIIKSWSFLSAHPSCALNLILGNSGPNSYALLISSFLRQHHSVPSIWTRVQTNSLFFRIGELFH